MVTSTLLFYRYIEKGLFHRADKVDTRKDKDKKKKKKEEEEKTVSLIFTYFV